MFYSLLPTEKQDKNEKKNGKNNNSSELNTTAVESVSTIEKKMATIYI